MGAVFTTLGISTLASHLLGTKHTRPHILQTRALPSAMNHKNTSTIVTLLLEAEPLLQQDGTSLVFKHCFSGVCGCHVKQGFQGRAGEKRPGSGCACMLVNAGVPAHGPCRARNNSVSTVLWQCSWLRGLPLCPNACVQLVALDVFANNVGKRGRLEFRLAARQAIHAYIGRRSRCDGVCGVCGGGAACVACSRSARCFVPLPAWWRSCPLARTTMAMRRVTNSSQGAPPPPPRRSVACSHGP